tara:strand:+ start:7852 stop:8304 length:453 start_codon:yes stop_codon:yes gene_type:complete
MSYSSTTSSSSRGKKNDKLNTSASSYTKPPLAPRSSSSSANTFFNNSMDYKADEKPSTKKTKNNEFDDMPDLIDEDGNVVKSQEKTLQKDDKEEQSETQEINLLDIEVETENIALNLLVSFINLAQRRGAFNIAESAKIWDCIKKFQKRS